MEAESYLAGNITLLVIYLAIAFFLLGLWLGWVLRGSMQNTQSAWVTGHPHHATTIAPLLNPAVYANGSTTGKTATKAEQPAKAASANTDTSGHMDEALGLVYSQAPEQQDDLTALKGVAAVLNGKLNDLGIYTYRQIASWNDDNVAEVSTRLSFKDRVKRDDWIGQARALHKEKYGEDLA